MLLIYFSKTCVFSHFLSHFRFPLTHFSFSFTQNEQWCSCQNSHNLFYFSCQNPPTHTLIQHITTPTHTTPTHIYLTHPPSPHSVCPCERLPRPGYGSLESEFGTPISPSGEKWIFFVSYLSCHQFSFSVSLVSVSYNFCLSDFSNLCGCRLFPSFFSLFAIKPAQLTPFIILCAK